MENCAVCLSADGFECTVKGFGNRDAYLYDCAVCGRFAASRTAIVDYLQNDHFHIDRFARAVLSHRVRTSHQDGSEPILLTTYDIELLTESEPRLPSPAQQSISAVRFIGELLQLSFSPITSLPTSFQAVIGAPTRHYALKMVRELGRRRLVDYIDAKTPGNPYDVTSVDLTLDGWEVFEQERRGEIETDTGFLAMKFGDEILDPFVKDVIKPSIEKLGYNLFDLRDVSRAGVIDNILRAQIRDAKFVIVDLTHDNSGAYWEAGFAEGLGKPVIYICEKNKFDEKKTHFDTNHCTTVLWNLDESDAFLEQLIATIRRSIGYN